jgi:hypothetical protein
MQQIACHLDFSIKCNDCFTTKGSGAARTVRGTTGMHFVVTLCHLNPSTEAYFHTSTRRVVPSINM